jgi:hypothetical protein
VHPEGAIVFFTWFVAIPFVLVVAASIETIRCNELLQRPGLAMQD